MASPGNVVSVVVWANLLILSLAFGQRAYGPQATESGGGQACSDEAPASFIKWSREHAIPLASSGLPGHAQNLSALRKIVADARVVGLGESARRVQEFYGVRSRIFKFLVEEMGFSALVTETGLVEAARINDYLLGRIDEPQRWQDWFTFGFGDEVELQDLLRWMRAYNQNPNHPRKIHFYGMDSMVIYSSPSTAVERTVDFLDRVDPEFRSSATKTDLLALADQMGGSGQSRRDMEISLRKYLKLSGQLRDQYTARLADTFTRLRANRLAYIERSSEEAYEWGYQFAVAARQLDAQYRAVAAQLKPGEELNSNDVPGAIFGIRDAAMFENVSWVLRREGDSSRVALWAHNAHLSKGAINEGTGGVAGVFASGPRLGMFLDSAFGSAYVSIGTAFGEGKPGWQPPQGPARCGTVDRELGRVGPSEFILDIRAASRANVADRWMSRPLFMRADNQAADYRVQLPKAWDAIIFIRRVSPVRVVP